MSDWDYEEAIATFESKVKIMYSALLLASYFGIVYFVVRMKHITIPKSFFDFKMMVASALMTFNLSKAHLLNDAISPVVRIAIFWLCFVILNWATYRFMVYFAPDKG